MLSCCTICELALREYGKGRRSLGGGGPLNSERAIATKDLEKGSVNFMCGGGKFNRY